ncbi:Homeobox protein PKNOX1 [Galemys pyrenaicus]|uniref:Homeobox protein PKNOX1 n=1 Tax=Galemys pyrenaicus TaxID=202257 RepID=A0A8J5ZM02_GALPY|nr:Homeobox protein PKNOX1 [Galemys pyrenaicus]
MLLPRSLAHHDGDTGAEPGRLPGRAAGEPEPRRRHPAGTDAGPAPRRPVPPSVHAHHVRARAGQRRQRSRVTPMARNLTPQPECLGVPRARVRVARAEWGRSPLSTSLPSRSGRPAAPDLDQWPVHRPCVLETCLPQATVTACPQPVAWGRQGGLCEGCEPLSGESGAAARLVVPAPRFPLRGAPQLTCDRPATPGTDPRHPTQLRPASCLCPGPWPPSPGLFPLPWAAAGPAPASRTPAQLPALPLSCAQPPPYPYSGPAFSSKRCPPCPSAHSPSSHWLSRLHFSNKRGPLPEGTPWEPWGRFLEGRAGCRAGRYPGRGRVVSTSSSCCGRFFSKPNSFVRGLKHRSHPPQATWLVGSHLPRAPQAPCRAVSAGSLCFPNDDDVFLTLRKEARVVAGVCVSREAPAWGLRQARAAAVPPRSALRSSQSRLLQRPSWGSACGGCPSEPLHSRLAPRPCLRGSQPALPAAAASFLFSDDASPLQMQVVTELKTEQDPSCSEPEAEGVSPPPGGAQTPMDADKQAIYRHPLFPLLALLFEKCEQSTQGSEGTTSASFDVDIENFVRKQEKEGKPFFCEDPETDNLPCPAPQMVKAIQVLRIHLLELEKVNELCKDFCSRYIACLKTKMNSETLLSGEPGGPYSPVQPQVQTAIAGTLSPQGIVLPASALQQGNVTMATVAGGTVYQPVTVVTPQGQVVTQALPPGTIRIQNPQLQLQLNQDLSILHSDDSSSKNKRGVLPKHATSVMRSWLFQHIGHPYPTEDEKKQIAAQTNLTLLQVNNWFINARRRILQPMLDSSCSETPKAKKKTAQNRPVQRFWPDSIASGAVPPAPSDLAMSEDCWSLPSVPTHTHTCAHAPCLPHRADPACSAAGAVVTIAAPVSMSVDSLQSLSSDGATLAVQQVMMAEQSEDESVDSSGDGGAALGPGHIGGLVLENSDSLQ